MITKRIIHIVHTMDPKSGGVSQAVDTIIAGLTRLGVHSEVASLDAPDAGYLGGYPFPIHALGPGQGPWAYSAKLIPWLRATLHQFDRVIVHGLWLYYSYATFEAVKQSRWTGSAPPPIYVMPHGMLDPYFQQAPSRKLKAVRNWAYWKLIERNVVNQADGLLFTCMEELRLACQPFRPYRPKHEINVGYGIQAPPPFTPAMADAFRAKCPGLDGQPYLLFLSRVNYKKGVDLLIKAYSILVETYSKTAYQLPKLVIAGPGLDTDYGQDIRQLLNSLQFPDSTVFLPGMLMGDAKWGAFYGCDAFVLPSHQENFGIAVVEALSCRKPVLISDKVNIFREIVAARACFSGPDTVDGTLDSLKCWLRLTSDEKREMAARAHNAFKNEFSIGPAAERLLSAVSNPQLLTNHEYPA